MTTPREILKQLKQCKESLAAMKFSQQFHKKFQRYPTPAELSKSLSKIAALKTLERKDRAALIEGYKKSHRGIAPSKAQLADLLRRVGERRTLTLLQTLPSVPTGAVGRGQRRKRSRKGKYKTKHRRRTKRRRKRRRRTRRR